MIKFMLLKRLANGMIRRKEKTEEGRLEDYPSKKGDSEKNRSKTTC